MGMDDVLVGRGAVGSCSTLLARVKVTPLVERPSAGGAFVEMSCVGLLSGCVVGCNGCAARLGDAFSGVAVAVGGGGGDGA